ncbi:hypothetical protein HMPREF0908_1888 [Selenomonas flueggei ATCC 43531]|uniref:Uncharacterized protein n=1 Tax=Selenomonas flueggei ATCC 43531 TaxID=638302 RepID=C4V5Y8_9FIRM|nr:hypothetical protein HMPREF0908_1888 [Selenomonas flueggei ATCC 43531]
MHHVFPFGTAMPKSHLKTLYIIVIRRLFYISFLSLKILRTFHKVYIDLYLC